MRKGQRAGADVMACAFGLSSATCMLSGTDDEPKFAGGKFGTYLA